MNPFDTGILFYIAVMLTGVAIILDRIAKRLSSPECDHARLEPFGRGSAVCSECDRVWHMQSGDHGQGTQK